MIKFILYSYLLRNNIPIGFKFLKKRLHINHIITYYYNMFKVGKTFNYNGKKYPYFYHHYNTTWGNERCLEIAIFKGLISPGINILEIGNVLGNYIKRDWDVIDKFEVGPNIINKDIEYFNPETKYDLIISISTFEHIGFNDNYDNIDDPKKILRVIDNIKKYLKVGGKLMVSIPLGYNISMDEHIKKGRINFNREFYFKKYGKEWSNVKKSDVFKKFHGKLFYKCHEILIGEIIGGKK